MPIGTLTLKSKDVDSFTTEVVEETRIVSHLRATVKTDVAREMMNLPELKHQPEKLKNQKLLNLRGQLADHTLDVKRTTVCCHMHQAIAENKTEDSIMTEAMAFAVNSCTPAAMETRTILRLLRIAKAFVMTLLVFVIWLLCMVAAPKILQNGTLTLTVKNAKNLNLADVTEIKIISTTKDRVKMFANTIPVLQKLFTSLHRDQES